MNVNLEILSQHRYAYLMKERALFTDRNVLKGRSSSEALGGKMTKC